MRLKNIRNKVRLLDEEVLNISWTKEEKEILENAYKNKIPIFTIPELKNKSEREITATSRYMGLFDKYPEFDQFVGRTYYQLTLLRKVGRTSYGHNLYECLCTCGNKTVVNIHNLRSGHTRSCGCLWKNMPRKSPSTYNDLTGKRFGLWTVLKRGEDYVSPEGGHSVRFLCRCDCGNESLVFSRCLLDGTSKSCGCISTQLRVEQTKKYNRYDLSGMYGIGYDDINNKEFYFDLEDFDKIKNFSWTVNEFGYVTSTDQQGRGVRFHRVVMGLYPDGDFATQVDHIINENKNDNRKRNLRIVTISQNSMNQKIRSDNTSGVTGVYYDKKCNKWRAGIGYNNKLIHLGSYENFDDAVLARKNAEEKYFGEYSYGNSQSLKDIISIDNY